MSAASDELCEHGVSTEEFCEPCRHHPAEEWAGYPVTICAWEVVPWPCEYERNRRAAAGVSTRRTER